MSVCIQNAALLGSDATPQCTADVAFNKLIAAADQSGHAVDSIETKLEALSNLPADTNVVQADAGNTSVTTITFPANTGVWIVTIGKCTLITATTRRT